jgi:hypothetical protein
LSMPRVSKVGYGGDDLSRVPFGNVLFYTTSIS